MSEKSFQRVYFTGVHQDEWITAKKGIIQAMRAQDCLDAVDLDKSNDRECPISSAIRELEMPAAPISLSVRLFNAKSRREDERTSKYIAHSDERGSRPISSEEISERVRENRATIAANIVADEMEESMIADKYRMDLTIYLADLDKFNNLFRAGQTVQERRQAKAAKAFKILSESVGPIAQAYAREEFAIGDPALIWKVLNERYGSDPRQEVSYLHNVLKNIKL